MTAKENILKFVCAEEPDGELLQSAFDKAKSSDLNVQMVSATELLKQDLGNDKSLFVTDVFHGECFDSLYSQKKRIFGPLCILRCLEKMIPLPNVYQPVYCLAMSGAVVSCTNVSKPLRDKLYRLVEQMGGNLAKDFTSAVTHLIAGEVGSKKYAIACSLKKPVVLPTWVEEAWKVTQKQDFDAKDPEFVASHLCPILQGCTICVTGIQAKKRREIKSAVEKHGGTYSAELKLRSTTHLLVENPTGEKYEFALRWNVHCVHPRWLQDCIDAGHWLDESSYLVKVEKDLDRTRSAGGQLSVTTVNATMNSTIAGDGASRKAAEAAQRSAEIHGHKDIFHESRLPTVASAGLRKNVNECVDNDDNNDDLDYNVPIPSGEMFLDGCKVYLTGFTGKKLEYFQKIINAGGGTRFNQINSGVSHVVMGQKLPKEIDKLTKLEFSPHIVTAKWLLDSCCQNMCLPEQDYYCMETEVNILEEIEIPVEGNKKAKKQGSQVVLRKENHVEDDVLSQYIDLMKDNVPNVIEQEPNTGKELKDIKEPDNVAPLGGEDTSIEGGDAQTLFHGLTFQIQGFSEDQEIQLENVMESNGGVVLKETSTKMVDFLVLPMNYEPHNYRAKSVVTFCWLERSIECGQLLDPSSNFLFTPFSLVKNAYPLKDCVISISQYAGLERDHLMQLAEMLGAHYQDYFSRKIKANLLANTQLLLLEPTGSKYDAALRWNIPAVNADWLFECARTGTKVAEGPFIVDQNQSPEGEEQEEVYPVSEKTPISGPSRVLEKGGRNTELDQTSAAPGRGTKIEAELLENKENTKNPVSREKPTAIPTNAPPVINKLPSCFGRPKRPSFDLTDAIEVLQSPCCSSGSSSAHSRRSRGSRSSFLLDDYIQEHMQAALKNTANPLCPSLDGSYQASTIVKENQSKENESLESQEFLRGVILCVGKKLSKQQADIHDMASAVGADCRWSLDDSCTHVIHEGRLTKDYNQAKCKGVHVVSPHWLYACVEEQHHVDESLYPPTYNPKLTLSVTKTRRSVRSSKEIKRETEVEETRDDSNRNKEDVDKSRKTEESRLASVGSPTTEAINDREIVMKSAVIELKKSELEGKAFSQDSCQSVSLQTKEEIRQIQELTQAMTKSNRRRSKRLNSSNSGHNSRSSSGNSVGESSRKPTRRQSSRLRSLRSEQDDSQDEADEQAVETITYDDPKSRMERERIIAQLTNCGSNPTTDSECSEDNDETIDGKQARKCPSDFCTVEDNELKPIKVVKPEPTSPYQTPTPAAPPIALQITSASIKPEPVILLDPVVEVQNIEPEQPPKFLLSAMSQQEKIDYGAVIEELGGEVYDNQYYNPICCHIIVGRLNRNEKCLASIAAGNWVLHKSYLEASRKAGHFVDEEPHEWGVEIPGEPLSNLAIAARRWRMELRKNSRRRNITIGAFQNWKVLLCVETSKLASFARLLEAGGANVLGKAPPFHDVNGVTHAFISPSKSAPVESVDFAHLEQVGILVLRTDYIVDYLTENPAPPSDKYVFPKPQERLKQQNMKRKPEETFPEITEKRQRRS